MFHYLTTTLTVLVGDFGSWRRKFNLDFFQLFCKYHAEQIDNGLQGMELISFEI